MPIQILFFIFAPSILFINFKNVGFMVEKINVINSVKDQLLFMADNVLDEKFDKVALFAELCRMAGRLDFVCESLRLIQNSSVANFYNSHGTGTNDK